MTRLCELAGHIAGSVVGDGQLDITDAATLDCALPGQITFIDSADKIAKLGETQASAAIVPRGVAWHTMSVIQVDDASAAFAAIVARFHPPHARPRIGISAAATVSPRAMLADDVDVYPGAFVEEGVTIGRGSTIHAGVRILAGSKIGEHVTIFPNAVLYEGTHVGDRSVIHSGVVLGSYGFGYRLVNGQHQLSAQLGNVVIESDVEIGANTSIDRGAYGPTVIGAGTKIDSLVQIAHNCRLGKHNIICSQVGIAGSTTTGDYVVMAGQVGVRDHVHIGTGAVLGAKCGVSNDVADGARMLGTPAVAERDQKVLFGAIAKLPETRKQIKELRRNVTELQAAIGGTGKSAAA